MLRLGQQICRDHGRVGLLVGYDQLLPATVVAITSSLMLALKRQLHELAWGLTREELQSVIEFAILAFVVYPLLPAGTYAFGVGGRVVRIEPRVVWLMVVTVAGIGIVNYAVVKSYGGRGIAVTGFFGGLVSSTAVVGTMLDHVRQRPAATSYAVAAILLADAAMALRNLFIATAFTLSSGLLVGLVVPLGVVVAVSVVVAAVTADWHESVAFDLESPFSLRNALGFGAIFLVIIVVGAFAESQFGTVGFYATAAFSGLVSSAGVTTSAVVLYRAGTLTEDTAVFGIMIATAASVAVKAGLVLVGSERPFAYRVTLWSGAVLLVAGVATALVVG